MFKLLSLFLVSLVASFPAFADDDPNAENRYTVTGSIVITGSTPLGVCVKYVSAKNGQANYVSHINPKVVGTTCSFGYAKFAGNDYTTYSFPITDSYTGNGGGFGGSGGGGSWSDDDSVDDSSCDTAACNQLVIINQKLNTIHNNDITNVNNFIQDMSTVINNIDNSLNELNIIDNSTELTNIDNSLTNIISNIETNNITNNEWLQTINNEFVELNDNQDITNQNIQDITNQMGDIYNELNEYSLKLGDINLALGDIDFSLDNTNKLVLDLGLDMDFIKNKLATDDSIDYKPYLNAIISLLSQSDNCVPSDTVVCPQNSSYDDTLLLLKIQDLQNKLIEDFEPDDSDTTVAVTDLTDIELDRDLIDFGPAQCPADEPIDTVVNGFSFSSAISHQRQCNFFVAISPFVKALGGFVAALTLGGGLRRG